MRNPLDGVQPVARTRKVASFPHAIYWMALSPQHGVPCGHHHRAEKNAEECWQRNFGPRRRIKEEEL